MKKLIFILILCMSSNLIVYAQPPQLDINARSSVLMEHSTGKILFENNPDEQLPIASVTKIMTMLLIMEALDVGKIKLDDIVPVSERAMSMGGSTMFLAVGETVTVDEMLKGIAVASANDGTVAMAEFISGSEDEFINQMNKKAQELGMKNTSFKNTNGLDAEGHYSSARDVAIMSAELIKYQKIFEYTKIWTDTMRGGKYELANTNKLIRFYDGANGLKTGSTSGAKCCLSATALRDGMQLIAVVLGAPDSKSRFNSARALLDYGFSAYSIREIIPAGTSLGKCSIKKSRVKEIDSEIKIPKTMLIPKNSTTATEYSVHFFENLNAPVYAGDVIGEAVILLDGKETERLPVFAAEDAPRKTFIYSLSQILSLLYKADAF